MLSKLKMMNDFNEKEEGAKSIHIPVMLNEVVEYLDPKPNAVMVDCTLGLGGHAEVILKMIGSDGRLIAMDRDKQALELAKKNLDAYKGQCVFVHDDYRNIDKVLKDLEINSVDGILIDLGLSSLQLDDPQRGFSIRNEGPLDMRMNRDQDFSAFDLVNSLSEKEISELLKCFGQERWHQRIARLLVKTRSSKPIETTSELRDIVLRAMPRQRSREKIHPATRTFQAFRIAVNRELESLEEVLEKCIRVLKCTGRIGVISFHSLEDRIVKQKFRAEDSAGRLKLITKKPLLPSEGEKQCNPRSRSAKFRVAECLIDNSKSSTI